MAGISRGVHTAVLAFLGLLVIVAVCGVLQRLAPDDTVRPIAERFLCSGQLVRTTPVSQQATSSLFTRVECLTGGTPDDVTTMAFAVLTIPCALALGAATVLVKRFAIRAPRTVTRRAHA